MLITVFPGCPKNDTSNLQNAVQFDSTSLPDSSFSFDTGMYKHFTLPAETQIQVFSDTIDGKTFVNACYNISYLFFTFPKASGKYNIIGWKINPSVIISASFHPLTTSETIPSTTNGFFTIRNEKISTTDINNFFDGLSTEYGLDFRANASDYWINIMADYTIQHDVLGDYFDIIISASPKGSPNTQSVTKGRVHPCPPCY